MMKQNIGKSDWLLYGATGYTGQLIAQQARRRGLTPILAGRRATVQAIAATLQLPFRQIALDEPVALVQQLRDVRVVLHCAGPFSVTSAPMVAACLAAGSHYLDITGEIAVFEALHQQHEAAQRAGIVLCPGVGFDVMPTDCLAMYLKEALPDATSLALGFDSRSGFSPGTLKTSLEGLAQGGKVRRDGSIVTVPLVYRTRTIDFGNGPKMAVTIPWGDVATAYYSTGIPNIEVYMAASPKRLKTLRRIDQMRWLLRWTPLRTWLQRRIAHTVQGPDATTRQRHPTFVWGEVRNAAGHTKTARLKLANGYDVTVWGALSAVTYLLRTDTPRAGFCTPSQLLGKTVMTTWPDTPAPTFEDDT